MSDLNDIVAVGLDLKPETLIRAYSEGVFPWPTEGLPLLWYSPQKRAVIDFDELHIARRLKKDLKKSPWLYTADQAFIRVIEGCSIREDEGTWITPEMKDAYLELHRLGHAHSIEVWEGGDLIGGMYGVDIGGYFAGESMFHRKSNASKAALLYATACLKRAGRSFLDIQVLSDHTASFGAKEISRSAFRKRITECRKRLESGEFPAPFKRMDPENYGSFSMVIE
jgi:leucyl/phenylalanyl-tRNA--protein transferase